jgi:protein tyrosine/serine phosphatase
MTSPQLTPRWLDWPDCLNVRDVGGLPTRAGGRIRPNALIRADSLDRLTDSGIVAFRAAGVSRIIDLRRSSEAGAARHPFVEEEIYRNVPVQDPADPDHEWLTLAEIYIAMLELRPTFFADVLAAVADAPPGPVVVHCAGGKDRTGIITAMALSLADVDDAVIGADYALSEQRLREGDQVRLAAIEDSVMRERLQALLATPPQNMLTVLDHLRSRHGGVEEYLRSGGVTDQQLAAIRDRLHS